MISARTLLFLGIAAGTYWVWQSGAWRPLVDQVSGFFHTGTQATDTAQHAPEPVVTTPAQTSSAPEAVHTWRDADGVVHFANSGNIPAGAGTHTLQAPAPMAVYEQALEQEKGITPTDIARARQAREQAAAAPPAGTTVTGQASAASGNSGDIAGVASAQARELLQRQAEALEKIRQENAR